LVKRRKWHKEREKDFRPSPDTCKQREIVNSIGQCKGGLHAPKVQDFDSPHEVDIMHGMPLSVLLIEPNSVLGKNEDACSSEYVTKRGGERVMRSPSPDL
jgi:hypothetical protein